jgi:hypothetical protein
MEPERSLMCAWAFFLLLTGVLFAAILSLLMSMFDNHGFEREVLAELRDIKRYTACILVVAGDIRALLRSKISQARITVMPKTIEVGKTSTATISAQDQNGAPIVIDATYTVNYSASNPASVSIGTPNPDGSAVITGVAADPGNSISAVITRPDGGTVSASPDTLIITSPPPPAPVLTTASVVLT